LQAVLYLKNNNIYLQKSQNIIISFKCCGFLKNIYRQLCEVLSVRYRTLRLSDAVPSINYIGRQLDVSSIGRQMYGEISIYQIRI